MCPRRKRNTETGSGILNFVKDFSSRSWKSDGPHISTQANNVSHWWWEIVSCSVFLTYDERD